MSLLPGKTVYLRHWQRDQLGMFFPMQIADCLDDGLLLWAPAGAQGWHFNMPDGRGMAQTPLAEWSAARRVPAPHAIDHGLLSWHPRGRDYSVRWFFRPDGSFYQWYANLEAAASVQGGPELTVVDTVDWDLDVVVHPDRAWEWKDEDEFVARLAQPDAYWVDDEERVRRAGREIVELVGAGAFPFDGTWCDFRPDPAWPALVPADPVDNRLTVDDVACG
ncbi:DUF402 domain-containing protein [Actinoplanes sp. Pm04-4]|uniref:DUF402 domain-containing protein n=1 Tax=Paractinoplanes pyxinae TaxID=2997416 RepID=A0ABT4B489_9ACTN|nr:DUF402 domain-containing protein [Actinoplanes pyxinae]MCY1141318.1 DUF402 domain-containing protein [Actinoplanes pyxinae]